jgi:hypothetical protein
MASAAAVKDPGCGWTWIRPPLLDTLSMPVWCANTCSHALTPAEEANDTYSV